MEKENELKKVINRCQGLRVAYQDRLNAIIKETIFFCNH